MPMVTLPDSVQMYYETEGAGEPLLLLMGQGSDHHGWGPLRADFAARWQVIVFDYRGTGQSDKPESPPYTLRGFAQDAVALLDHLGLAHAHAFGISMGGRVAQWLAIDHPDRVGALVLGCTSPGDAHGVPRSARVEAAMASGRALTLMLSPLWAITHWGQLSSMRPDTPPMPDYARVLHQRASAEHNVWDDLPRIAAPTLVIHGTRDEVNPTANAHLLAERIPGAELHLVSGGRHMFYLQYRAEVERVVMAFLARHALSG